MKRVGGLFEPLCSWENLLAAEAAACRGRRFRPAPAAFRLERETLLARLREELREGTYRPGPYHAFPIRDPKPRLISAAPYRDRVVQHALCSVAVIVPDVADGHEGSASEPPPRLSASHTPPGASSPRTESPRTPRVYGGPVTVADRAAGQDRRASGPRPPPLASHTPPGASYPRTESPRTPRVYGGPVTVADGA
ncbi:MAG: hypothetical protein FJX77_16745, partial [Armatimonadetes bacterium]|nr:hypothetical protein [Armatimonadota bacterium]